MKINKLSQYQLYSLIFKPIFNYEIKYPKSWNEKDIINRKKLPEPFFIDDEDEAYLEYKKEEDKILKGFNGVWYQLNSNQIEKLRNAKNLVLEKYFKYDRLILPRFSVKTNKKEKFVEIVLDNTLEICIKNNIFGNGTELGRDFEKKEILTDRRKYYIIFYQNGDIKISNYNERERGVGGLFNRSTVTEVSNIPRFLSYTETLNMNKYITDNNIEIF